MLRIGICDDEVNARDSLRFELEKVLTEDTEQIVYEFTSGKNAVNWLRKHPGEIDLLFLDIEMKNYDGMTAARDIRTFDETILLVFVTGYSDYVFEGYKVAALDYMIKPVTSAQLLPLIKRVRTSIEKGTESVFTFHNVDGTYRIARKEILYFYSDKRLVYLVTKNKKYGFYAKLNTLEEQLDDFFIRIHQRYLINPHHVSCISAASVTVSGRELPISRSLKEIAMKKLALSVLGDNET